MVTKKLQQIVDEAIFACFNENINSFVHMSNLIDLCDYQCDDCFSMAKKLRTAPISIATKIVEHIKSREDYNLLFYKVEAVNPGFINFVLSDSFITENLNLIAKDDKFGVETPKNPELYFLDYGGPNIAKPLHVGHLRSPIIGESVKRIINFSGNKTMSDVHFGDFGLQIGEVIYGLKERNIKNEDITLELLNEIYPNMSARIKLDEELNQKCAQITKDLQDGVSPFTQEFEIIKEISKKDILRIYNYLDVHFDLLEGESDSYKYINKLTNLLNEKNLLEDSQGAKIININKETDKKELPPLIYQKSNGAYLYGTTDMATVLERVQEYKPNHIIYFADKRQDLHYTQFFRAIAKTDIINEEQLEFYGFGTVNGLDGKPYKTREGISPSLDSLFNEVKTLLQNNREMNLSKPEDLDKIVNSVIKFADLQNNYEKDYIFDLEKFSKTEGKTGPYLLYSYCRLNKILNDFAKVNKEFKLNSKNKIEKEVKLKILSFKNVFEKAFVERKPSILAEFVYDFSTKLNAFYETNRLNNKDNEEFVSSWLKLIEISLKLIKTILNLLIIDTPERM